MKNKLVIDGPLYHPQSGKMMELALLLFVGVPLVLIVIGVCWLHLISLVATNITGSLQSLVKTI